MTSPRRVYYDWKSATGKTGRSTEGGIAKLLRAGTRFVSLGRVKPATIADRIVAAARSQLGVLEHPANENTGPAVQAYQAATTLGGTGWPYCVAFGVWTWKRAGLTPGYQGGYAPHAEFWARKAGKWSSKPTRGAWVLFDFLGRGYATHLGVVEEPAPLVTIEGNTTAGAGGNQAEGGGVWRRLDRKAPQIRGFVRP